jgi:hypothetical protein
MKKLVTGIMALFVAVVISTAVSAASKDSYEFKGGSFGKVAFSHKIHQEKLNDCKVCHHKDEPGKEVGCVGCHTKESKVNTKAAFHDSCIKCHKEKSQGPKGCKDCHKK